MEGESDGDGIPEITTLNHSLQIASFKDKVILGGLVCRAQNGSPLTEPQAFCITYFSICGGGKGAVYLQLNSYKET